VNHLQAKMTSIVTSLHHKPIQCKMMNHTTALGS
jgi:hypothetical protein